MRATRWGGAVGGRHCMPWVCMGPRVRKGAMGEDIPLDMPTPKPKGRRQTATAAEQLVEQPVSETRHARAHTRTRRMPLPRGLASLALSSSVSPTCCVALRPHRGQPPRCWLGRSRACRDRRRSRLGGACAGGAKGAGGDGSSSSSRAPGWSTGTRCGRAC
eukprot:COSAG02_NODE_897_length_16123_cov_10.462993_7_plen_161_part_00